MSATQTHYLWPCVFPQLSSKKLGVGNHHFESLLPVPAWGTEMLLSLFPPTVLLLISFTVTFTKSLRVAWILLLPDAGTRSYVFFILSLDPSLRHLQSSSQKTSLAIYWVFWWAIISGYCASWLQLPLSRTAGQTWILKDDLSSSMASDREQGQETPDLWLEHVPAGSS
jgi:hypothetical protein